MLSWIAIAISGVSLVLASRYLQASSSRVGVNWSITYHSISSLPYVFAACIAAKFSSNVVGAVISLVGAIAVGVIGVLVVSTAADALAVQASSFFALLGCVVVLLTHLLHWGIRKTNKQTTPQRARMNFFRTWCLVPLLFVCFPALPYLGLWLGSGGDGVGLICALVLSLYYLPAVVVVSPWMPMFFENGQFGGTPTLLGHFATAIIYGLLGLAISWANALGQGRRA